MMQSSPQTATYEEFKKIMALPQNQNIVFEFIAGRVIQRMSIQKYYVMVITEIACHLMQSYRLDSSVGTLVMHVDHWISEEAVFCPSVSFTSRAREPVMKAYPTIAPDLAVEVISNSNLLPDVIDKTRLYFKNGSRIVWIVDVRGRTVHVYDHTTSEHRYTVCDEDDTIDGGSVLPNLSIKAGEFFPKAILEDDAL
jgi:Uma2 family endonuclease